MEDELKTYCKPYDSQVLTDEQKESFIKDRVLDCSSNGNGEYPIRFVNLQQPSIGPLYLLSFMCIKDSKYLKIRGHATSKEEAVKLAKKLAEKDTYFYIVMAEEGLWYEVVPQNQIKSRETLTLVDQSVILESNEEMKTQIKKEKEEIARRVDQLKLTAVNQIGVVPEMDLLILNHIKINDTKKQLEYIESKQKVMLQRLRCLAGIVNLYEKNKNLKEEWFQHYKTKLQEIGSNPLEESSYYTNEVPLEGDLNDLTAKLIDIELEYDRTRPS